MLTDALSRTVSQAVPGLSQECLGHASDYIYYCYVDPDTGFARFLKQING